MLYNEEGKLIVIETENMDRMELFNKVIANLGNKMNSVMDYIGKKIDEYFTHYENQGKKAHLKAAYILGGTWEETPMENVYEAILEIFQHEENISFDKAKEIAGCLIRRYMINDKENSYLGTYINGYVYSRESA